MENFLNFCANSFINFIKFFKSLWEYIFAECPAHRTEILRLFYCPPPLFFSPYAHVSRPVPLFVRSHMTAYSCTRVVRHLMHSSSLVLVRFRFTFESNAHTVCCVKRWGCARCAREAACNMTPERWRTSLTCAPGD